MTPQRCRCGSLQWNEDRLVQVDEQDAKNFADLSGQLPTYEVRYRYACAECGQPLRERDWL